MVAAVVASAIVVAAVVTFTVVAAYGVGIVDESAAEQSSYAKVCAAVCTGVELDVGLSEGVACAAADAAADKNVNIEVLEETCKSAVAAADSAYNLRGNNSIVLYGVDLKLLAVTEMLKNLAKRSLNMGITQQCL